MNITVSWGSPGESIGLTQVNGIFNRSHAPVPVAGEPTNLTAAKISKSNSTHEDNTVYWESPDDNDTIGYIIYYQPKGGPVISDRVFGGETDTHSLDGLQRGVTYYISLVALSPHLPSPLVGPITVIPGESLTSPSSHHVLMSLSLSLSLDPLLVVETSPESLTTSHNTQFSVNCTARAEVDGEPLRVTIEWRRVTPSGTSELMPALYTTTGSPERGYQSVLTTSENDSTVNTTIYRCTATAYNHSSSSDTTVHFEGIGNQWIQVTPTQMIPVFISMSMEAKYTIYLFCSLCRSH